MAGEIQLNGTSFASESSGTITVNNGTLGSSVVFPTGHVINTEYNTYSTATPIGTSITSTGLTCQITPSSTSNLLIFNINIHYYIESSSIAFELRINDGSTDVYTDNGYAYSRNSDGTERAEGRYPVLAIINPASSGSPITYTVKMLGNVAFTVQKDSSPSQIVIQEIKQ